jgi:ATP-dependent exoDNAse (exonuclease V) alpha subunit
MTQDQAFTILESGANVFLTGPAGSGKTYVLNKFIAEQRARGKVVAVTASTGIAATHMDGVSIHSWAGIGIHETLSLGQAKAIAAKEKVADAIKSADILVIDEISMLDRFRLDAVQTVCMIARQSPLPFGGLQVVLCGDFFQLPPINRNGTEAHFAFKSNAWHAMNIQVCYLQEQHRQEDGPFLRLLKAIRNNSIDEEHVELLQTRMNAKIKSGIKPTRLYTHNIDVDAINQRELAALPGDEEVFPMYSEGPKKLIESLVKGCLAPEELVLKVGAAVMFVKNNFAKGYVNGTLGTVVSFDDEGMPLVKTFSGKEIQVELSSWEMEEPGKEKARIYQLPLRLAWAITIHKSQGMTLDAAEIDLRKSFVQGMGYVALSRVRSLSGISLLGINQIALQISPEVLEFNKRMIQASKALTAPSPI